eukprot:806741_1
MEDEIKGTMGKTLGKQAKCAEEVIKETHSGRRSGGSGTKNHSVDTYRIYSEDDTFGGRVNATNNRKVHTGTTQINNHNNNRERDAEANVNVNNNVRGVHTTGATSDTDYEHEHYTDEDTFGLNQTLYSEYPNAPQKSISTLLTAEDVEDYYSTLESWSLRSNDVDEQLSSSQK